MNPAADISCHMKTDQSRAMADWAAPITAKMIVAEAETLNIWSRLLLNMTLPFLLGVLGNGFFLGREDGPAAVYLSLWVGVAQVLLETCALLGAPLEIGRANA